MRALDEEAKRWLETYSHQLEPEEILSEREKEIYRWSDDKWPIPKPIYGMGIFAEINSEEKFNKIIGNSNNKNEILNNKELYDNWILPHAVLLFGKSWFDKTKWKKQIKSGVPFSLFSDEDKRTIKNLNCNLENTTAGKALISIIINKTSFALRMFLSQDRENINVGAYIIESIKNEIINYRGNEEGFKLQSVAVCPYCLSQRGKVSYKIPLIDLGNKRFMCPKCNDRAKNYKIQVENERSKENLKNYNKFVKFSNFFGMSCVCPSDNCMGKFIPIEFIENLDIECLQNVYIKSIKSFKKAPEEMQNNNITCPFCKIQFTLKEALKKSSGWKRKSGFLTGLPHAIVWKKNIINNVDNERASENINSIAGNNFRPENNIFIKQNLEIIKNEILIKMSEKNKRTYSGLTSWYFYLAAMKWINNFSEDAFKYFFNHSQESVRGNETSIHQSFFHLWMDVLNENIKDFNKFEIFNLEDFKWFCHVPKFSYGPKFVFEANVVSKKRILNVLSNKNIRFARVLSIKKENEEFIGEMKTCEWNAIQMRHDSKLQIGDSVEVKVLIMPGHHSHAPIKRIIRLKQNLFNGVVQEIISENKSGVRNKEFWEKWNEKLEIAKSQIKLSLGG